MKKIIFLLFILPATLFAQKNNKWDKFKHEEVIVTPEDYLPTGINPKDVKYIEFKRVDNNTPGIYACIYQREGLMNNFSIGQVYNYQTSDFEFSYITIIILNDGAQISTQHTIDFSNGVHFEEDYYDAVYSVDANIWDEYNGTIILVG